MKVGFKKSKISGFEQLDNEDTYRQILGIYENFVQRLTGRSKRTYFGASDSLEYRKKISNIRALILICTELGVTFERYLDIQFRVLESWLKKRGMSYPSFAMLVTEKAIDRFVKWETQQGKQYMSKKQASDSFFKIDMDYHRSLFMSAEKFQDHLLKVGVIDYPGAVQELEMLARMGYVTNLYVFCHPIVEECKNLYLKEVQQEVRNALTEDNKDILRSLRMDIRKKFGEEGVNLYV